MTPNEITTVIAQTLGREFDIPFRLQLMERVRVWRSRMIANSLQKNPAQRKFFRQPYYVPMSQQISVPCATLVSCAISVSVKPLPQLIRAGSTLFDYIGGVDGNSPFREVQPGTSNYMGTGRFAKHFPQFEYNNNLIYSTKKDLPLIRVDAIYDDPMYIFECNCLSAHTDCDTWNMEYPMSGDIAQLVIQSILQVDYNRGALKPTPEIQVNG